MDWGVGGRVVLMGLVLSVNEVYGVFEKGPLGVWEQSGRGGHVGD